MQNSGIRTGTKPRALAALVCICLLCGLFTAGAQAASYVPVTKIDTAGRTVLKVGETVHWSASAQPANATDKSLWWASGNPGVVTVNQNGYITAHKVGQSNITITAKNGFQKVILVTVSAINTAGKTTLAVGEKARWTAAVVPANTPNKSLYWAAGNPGVATVDQNGNITAHKAGKCNISVTEKNGVQKIILLTVGNPVPVTGIQTAGRTTIPEGETTRWTASVLPGNATDKSLFWAAGNPGVATVDQSGNITAHRAGQCNISVTAKNGAQKVVLLTVTEPIYINDVRITGETCLQPGATTTLKAAISPSDATQKLTWKSSNPAVATVDQNGCITAHSVGKCSIEVSFSRPEQRKTVTNRLTVKTGAPVAVTGIDFEGKYEMTVGETAHWTAAVVPSNADDPSLSWESEDPDVVTVDQSGNVTAKMPGCCDIVISAKNGIRRYASVTVNGVYDPKTVYNRMIAMKAELPEGMRWTNDDFYGIPNMGGYGCVGFALKVSSAAFGKLKLRTLENGEFTYEDLRVGDMPRVNNGSHTVLILEIHDDYVVIAEGNYNSSVHWGRKLKRDAVMKADYVWTRYPE